MAGSRRSFKTVKALQTKIDKYFKDCDAKVFVMIKENPVTEPYTVSGMACSLGVSRETVHLYSTGEYDTPDESYSDTIKKAVAKIERDKIAKAMLGLYDRTICIFDLKNNHNWKDRSELDVQDTRPLKNESTEEIEARLKLRMKRLNLGPSE